MELTATANGVEVDAAAIVGVEGGCGGFWVYLLPIAYCAGGGASVRIEGPLPSDLEVKLTLASGSEGVITLRGEVGERHLGNVTVTPGETATVPWPLADEFPFGDASVYVTDADGGTVASLVGRVQGGLLQLDVPTLPAGEYTASAIGARESSCEGFLECFLDAAVATPVTLSLTVVGGEGDDGAADDAVVTP